MDQLTTAVVRWVDTLVVQLVKLFTFFTVYLILVYSINKNTKMQENYRSFTEEELIMCASKQNTADKTMVSIKQAS